MKAVNSYIVVENIKSENNKIAGLIFTEKTNEDDRYAKANVISIGGDVKGIKEKDVVYYDKRAGHGIQYKNKYYYVIRQADVVLID